MFLEVKPEEQAEICETLRKRLSAKFPVLYPKLLESGMKPIDADNELIKQGVISEIDLLNMYCDALHVEQFDEKLFKLPGKLNCFQPGYLAMHSVLPLKMTEDTLTLVISVPYEITAIKYVMETFFKKKVCFEISRRSMVDRMVERIYIESSLENAAAERNRETKTEEDELLKLAGDSGIVNLVNEMFTQALESGASDIHIEPEEKELAVRFRVDGVINDYLKLPVADYPAIASRIKLISNLNIAERRLPQDGRTTFQLGSREMDLRVSTIPILNGESIVLRLLNKEAMKFDLKELGMNDDILKSFGELIQIPHGIILVVGPTGSGKTTTLYSVMCQLNDHHRKIITIEDPVEYQLPGLQQMQVNPKIGLSFANGLRSIVRQDPDVILVGEIRDKETADIAINAALTGHLVLSTLHTNDSVGAVIRLIDMGIEPFLITASLCGVLSQRLIRKTCRHCLGTGTSKYGQNGKCRFCGGSGFHGRTGVFELLKMNDPLQNAVHRKASNAEIERIALDNGLIPLFKDGMKKVRNGETTRAELLRSVADLSGEGALTNGE